MMPEIGKLVPTRPVANSQAAARMTPARSDDLDDRDPDRRRLGAHLLLHAAGVPLVVDDPGRTEDAEDHGARAERERSEVGNVAGADEGELRRNRDAGGLADELVATAEDEHAGQGHDEGRHSDVGDPEALPGADRGTDDEAEHDRQRPGEVPVGHGLRHHDARERRDRTDREVDVAGDDHHHHADREDQDVGVLVDDVDEVRRRESQSVRQHLEQQDDDDEAAEDAELAQVGLAAAEHLLDVGEPAALLLRRAGFGAHQF